MTRIEIASLFEADLSTLRTRVQELTLNVEARDNSGWIGAASKRQLLIEATYLLANQK